MGNQLLYFKPKNQPEVSSLSLEKGRELFALRGRVEGLSPKTLRGYNYALDTLKRWLEEKGINSALPVEDLDQNLLRQYFLTLHDRGLSKVSIATHHRALKVFFSFLVRENHLEENPLQKIAPPRIPKQFPHFLEEHQVKALLEAPKQSTYEGLRNYVILLAFLDTGMRLNELTRLSLKDVNLTNHSLRVTGKGEKTRDVFMGKKLVKVLHKWIQKRGYLPYEEALFLSRNGERLSDSHIEHMVHRLAKKAGISGVRCSPHTLRHTFATNYIRNGGDPFSLQQLLGHSDIKTVMIYVHMGGTALREAHAKFSPVDRMG